MVGFVADALSLVFENDLARLSESRERVRRHLENAGVDETAVHAVDLALEELAVNAIRYGYEEGAAGRLRVDVAIEPSIVRVTLVDDGRPFDPTRHPEPAPLTSLDAAPVGGWGISLVRHVSRSLRYSREPDGNRVEVEVSRAAS